MTRTKKKAQRGRKDGTQQRILNTDSRMNRPSVPDQEGEWQEEWGNHKFEAYYKAQHIIDDPEEWQLFMKYMRTTLPTTFRLPACKPTTPMIASIIETVHIPHLSGLVFEGEPIDPPKKIAWYPDGLAYELNASKRVIRKSPEFKKLHQFLVYETEVGNISRQEAVSMIPPLLLDVQPHHAVLDACASPGSKTAQLIEALHTRSSPSDPSLRAFEPIPAGVVIANDSDHARAQLLVHQSARIPSPSLMIMNLDASSFPTLKLPNASSLRFDRILCDVPCSGDGTLRKNVGIWKSWNIGSGNGLHNLQLRILLRAMQMLKPGGKIVYSTCSLNPVENEAVVAAALNANPGQFSLTPTSHLLPGLNRRPGLTSWTPAANSAFGLDRSSSGAFHVETRNDPSDLPEDSVHPVPPGDTHDALTFASYESYLENVTGADIKHGKPRMHPTQWPPENARTLGLENCFRVYPHLQNTGGFFVALLQKAEGEQPMDSSADAELQISGVKRLASDETSSSTPLKRPKVADAATDNSPVHSNTQPPNPKSQKPSAKVDRTSVMQRDVGTEGTVGTFKESPFTFIDGNDPTLKSNIEKLNLNSDFPSGNIFVRHRPGEPMKTFHLANDLVRSIIRSNTLDRMRSISAGVKVFSRQDAGRSDDLDPAAPRPTEPSADQTMGAALTFVRERDSTLRFVDDGITSVYDFVQAEGRAVANLPDLKRLLETYIPKSSDFEDDFGSWLKSKGPGSYVASFQPGEYEAGTLQHTLTLPIWKSTTSVSLMIDKQAKSALSLRIWGRDVSPGGIKKSHNPSSGSTPLE